MDEAIPGGEPGEPQQPGTPEPGGANDEAYDEANGEASEAARVETYDGAAPAPEAPEDRADDGPRPLGVSVAPTGHGEVDAQLRRLQDADHLAVSGHLEVYEDVHRGLRGTLTALDQQHNPGS